MAESMYQRLTGRKRTLLGYSQLWLAPDHILLVTSTRLAESYQRFALRDIQAITLTEMPGLLGARCRCYLHTAVSRELLAPVSRARIARTFLARVRPAIEAVQGSFPAEGAVTLSQPRTPPAAHQPPEIVRAPGMVPEVLFGLFLADATLVLLALRFSNQEVGGVLLVTFFAEVVLAIWALLRRDTHARRLVSTVIIVGLLCMGGDAVGFVRAAAGWLTQAMAAGPQREQAPQGFNYSYGAALFAAGWRMAVGVAGLAASFFERRRGAKR